MKLLHNKLYSVLILSHHLSNVDFCGSLPFILFLFRLYEVDANIQIDNNAFVPTYIIYAANLNFNSTQKA